MIRVRMKIKEGPSRGLCGSCKQAAIRTFENGETEVTCTAIRRGISSPVVNRPVTECSEHLDKNTPDRHEMEQIAWIIDPSKPKDKAGFLSPSDAKKKGLVDPW